MASRQQLINQKLVNAAKNGHFIEVKKCLKNGAQVDKPIEGLGGMTPIMVALDLADPWTKGHYEIVKEFLKRGANPNQTYPINEELIQEQPELELERVRDMSLLTRAVTKGHFGVIQLLVNKGADVNQKTAGNIGPLDILIESKTHITSLELRLQMIKFFLENKIATEYKDKRDNLSPFHRAVKEGQFEVARLLIDHGVNMESRNEFDNTPIVTAAFEGHLEIVKLLLEQGIDINSKGGKGYSMLHFAVEDFNFEIVEFLLEKGANVNARTGKNNTPLHSACNGSDHHLKRNKVTEILLEHGADISAINAAGATPLHFASEYGLNLAVQIFLKKGNIYYYL